jgi:hypothetical protein
LLVAQSATPVLDCPEEEDAVKNRLLIEAIVVVVAFLGGFLPQYIKTRRLESELHALQQANGNADLRDLAGLSYVQASQKNYGLAAATSARFFNRARELANQAADPAAQKALEDLMPPREKITAELAKGDPGVIGDLQDVFTRTRRATLPAGEQ